MTGTVAWGAPGATITPAGALIGATGERVALQDVQIDATLRDLLCEVRAVQVYRNEERRAIEAVYTFPLPLDAVLLDVTVTLGDRVLAGTVVEKRAAEARYEAAVAEGDGAVMLELAEPGLYTMNVGNLLPGEVARIAIRYALLHRWTGDRLRLHFPTTIAPRYGAMPVQPHQQPEQSLLVENSFSFSLAVHGALREAQFTCPSHALTQGATDDALVLSLTRNKAVMDRDVVIDVKAPQAARSVLLVGSDGEGTAAIASFQPFLGGLQQTTSLSLAIVVDCSGSMGGTSMQLAKRALQEILAQLHSDDHLGLVAFGSTTRAMANALLPSSEATLAQARAFCDALDADMGGTEIAQALDQAHRLLARAEGGNVFLITDGQVGEWSDVVSRSRATGHRHFTVGVGSAVTESFVRTLAERTGGAAELVSPQQGMSERIVRHFGRMRSARAARVRVRWPDGAVDEAPTSFGAVFDGDTLVAGARFAQPVGEGEVVLEVETLDGRVQRQSLMLSEATNDDTAPGAHSTVARMTASLRVATLDEEEARAVAVRYQLASPWTNWLVIAGRAAGEKAEGIPALRKVPQTLAAGWGGAGIVHAASHVSMLRSPPMMLSRLTGLASRAAFPPEIDQLDTPRFVHRQMDPHDPADGRDASAPGSAKPGDADGRVPPPMLAHEVVKLVNRDPSWLDAERLLDFIRSLGTGVGLDHLLRLAISSSIAPEVVCTVLVAEILERLAPRGFTLRGRRAVSRLAKGARKERRLIAHAPVLAAEIERVCSEICGG